MIDSFAITHMYVNNNFPIINTYTLENVSDHIFKFSLVFDFSKSQKKFFLKFHCPKNEQNIRQNSAL